MKIYGCDIGAKFIILHDGEKAYKIYEPEDLQFTPLQAGDTVVLEQTGAYGVRWAQIFNQLEIKVYIADGRDFKNYRLAHSRKKDDKIDALYLRKYYKNKKEKCREYNPQQINIRTLIRQHIRNQKDLTKHTNRLKQYLAIIFPLEDYHLKPRTTFIKQLPKIKHELINSPHALNNLALAELKKVEIALEENKALEQEIQTIAKHHQDYQILKTFPIGDLQIAAIIAYSHNIDTFKNKDAFIAYVLMGSNLEQSGTSIYKIKTDKARTEIKGLFYPLFMQAHRQTKNWIHPLKPLTEFVKTLVNTSYNYKKRYIKFLSRFLELIYYARKHQLTFQEVIDQKIEKLQTEIDNLKPKAQSQYQFYKLSRLTAAINTYKEIKQTINQNQTKAQRQDISDLKNKKAEHPVYMCQTKTKEKKEEKTNENKAQTNKKPKTNQQTTTNKIPTKQTQRKPQSKPNPKPDKSHPR